jgi:hypothetical protein
MLRVLSFDVANILCWVLCQGGWEEGSWWWMLHATRSQHGNNIVATWSQHGRWRKESRWYFDVAHNLLATCSQHARNICSIALNRTAEDWFNPHPMVTEASDASARIGHPGASSFVFLLSNHTKRGSEHEGVGRVGSVRREGSFAACVGAESSRLLAWVDCVGGFFWLFCWDSFFHSFFWNVPTHDKQGDRERKNRASLSHDARLRRERFARGRKKWRLGFRREKEKKEQG